MNKAQPRKKKKNNLKHKKKWKSYLINRKHQPKRPKNFKSYNYINGERSYIECTNQRKITPTLDTSREERGKETPPKSFQPRLIIRHPPLWASNIQYRKPQPLPYYLRKIRVTSHDTQTTHNKEAPNISEGNTRKSVCMLFSISSLCMIDVNKNKKTFDLVQMLEYSVLHLHWKSRSWIHVFIQF